MAPAHDAHHLPPVRVKHQRATTVALAGVHAALREACAHHRLGDLPLVCILCVAPSAVDDLDGSLLQYVRHLPSVLFCKSPSDDPEWGAWSELLVREGQADGPDCAGESKRELQLHEGNVVLSGVCGVRLKDEDLGHRQGWGAAQSV